MSTYIYPPISLSSGPVQYTRKSSGITSATTVLEDLDTPANSRALPVVIHSIDGAPINITAGDLNVNLTDRGSNPDATRIGDGVDLLAINSDGSISTKITDGAGTVNTKQIGTAITSSDVGLVAQSVIHGLSSGGGGGYVDVKVNPSGALTVEASVTSSTLPTGAATSALQTAEAVLIGAVTETAPASDTASSGLNGRLQRVAQRITSLIALFPTALGQGTMATSMKVVLPSDQSAIPVTMAAVPTGGATSALQTTGNTSLSSMVTNTGAQADAVATTDTGTFSLIALIKKVAQNITSLAGQIPASLGVKVAASSLSIAPASDAKFSIKPSAITTTYAENLALTTVTTITAPANAVSVLVMADDANANNIRIKQNGTASLTSGFPLQAGRDITFDGGQDLSVISDNAGSAGASVKIYFSWKIQA